MSLATVMRCRRLGRYIRWLAGMRGIPTLKHTDFARPIASWWAQVVMTGNVAESCRSSRDVCPVDAAEADRTKRCIQRLPPALRDTLVQEYVVCGTARQKADALGVTTRTLRRRITAAERLLPALFAQSDAGEILHIELPPKRGRPCRKEAA